MFTRSVRVINTSCGCRRGRNDVFLRWRSVTCSCPLKHESATITTATITTTTATTMKTIPTTTTTTATKRFFSSQDSNSNSNSDKTDDPVKEYLSSMGYKDPPLQDGMRDALRPVFGKDMTVEQLQSFGTAGLEALSNSVQEQLIAHGHDPNAFVGNATINIPHHNYSFDIQMAEGTNFITYATEGKGSEVLNEYLECACDGNMSCSTCHIVLDEETYSKLDPPCEAELDMLDLAYEPTDTSRLGCQIVMTREIDGMVITIPAGVNNLWG